MSTTLPVQESVMSNNQFRRKVKTRYSPQNVQLEDIDNLKKLTDTKFIEIASGDIVDHIQKRALELEFKRNMSDTYYQDILFALIQIRLPEEEARLDWRRILEHKYTMSEKLGRNVGIHVATLDYYTNIKKKAFTPMIVDAHEYADTASRALMDELTNACSRSYFEEELSRLFAEAKQRNAPFSLIMLDIDHFKMYNDFNGHIQGDLALIQTVQILQAVCHTHDTVSRYGGEEFTIILPEQNIDQAAAKAENIRKAVFDFRYVNEQQLPGGRLSVSLGVSVWTPDVETEIDLIKQADSALYKAKQNGRNQVCIYQHPQPIISENPA